MGVLGSPSRMSTSGGFATTELTPPPPRPEAASRRWRGGTPAQAPGGCAPPRAAAGASVSLVPWLHPAATAASQGTAVLGCGAPAQGLYLFVAVQDPLPRSRTPRFGESRQDFGATIQSTIRFSPGTCVQPPPVTVVLEQREGFFAPCTGEAALRERGAVSTGLLPQGSPGRRAHTRAQNPAGE